MRQGVGKRTVPGLTGVHPWRPHPYTLKTQPYEGTGPGGAVLVYYKIILQREPGPYNLCALPPVTRELRRVVLLTTFDEDAVLWESLRVGVQGFLLEDVTRDQLAEALHRVAGGETLPLPGLPGQVSRGVAELPRDFPSAAFPEALTRRELEVLRLIARGLSNREIAGALGTAEGTVKNQTSNILAKLGVRDRTQAVLRGMELGCL